MAGLDLFRAGYAQEPYVADAISIGADILGDWREEVIWRAADNKELRIYTTTMFTDRRFYTFMHDPLYRLSVAWQNVAYNQPAQPGFYMGDDMSPPPRPSVETPACKALDLI